jgi:hypothetical protein
MILLGIVARLTVLGTHLLTVPWMPEPVEYNIVMQEIYACDTFRFVIFYIKDEKSIVVEAVGETHYH